MSDPTEYNQKDQFVRPHSTFHRIFHIVRWPDIGQLYLTHAATSFAQTFQGLLLQHSGLNYVKLITHFGFFFSRFVSKWELLDKV